VIISCGGSVHEWAKRELLAASERLHLVLIPVVRAIGAPVVTANGDGWSLRDEILQHDPTQQLAKLIFASGVVPDKLTRLSVCVSNHHVSYIFDWLKQFSNLKVLDLSEIEFYWRVLSCNSFGLLCRSL
jgi:hypothetical protein